MNKKPENNIDEILDNVKNTPIPEGTFKSAEDFKAEFFSKVNQCELKRSSFARVCKWGTVATAAAATVVVGVNFLAPSISQTFAVLGTAAGASSYDMRATTTYSMEAAKTSQSASHSCERYSAKTSSSIPANDGWSDGWGSPAREWDGGSSGCW